MNTTFAMWRKSLTQLIKMEDKKEWDGLDILSKWFIATRSVVGTITLYSGLIGGLLAWQYLYTAHKPLNFLTRLVLSVVLHNVANRQNPVPHHADFSRGID